MKTIEVHRRFPFPAAGLVVPKSMYDAEYWARATKSASIQRGELKMRKVLPGTMTLVIGLLTIGMVQAAEPTYPIATDVKTTRRQTVRPVAIPGAIELTITQVDQYEPQGYSWWNVGAAVDAGPLLPDGSPVGAYSPAETLLTFFSMSDIHVVDKESPVQALYMAFLPGRIPPLGFGNTNTSAYSPVLLSTTHVLDAAVQTINALHGLTPFDFGISLGDAANSNQYNELRWYIDVMDGKLITPSSGAHRGANRVDYQKPYQPAGLDKSIPWYQTIGNHDQYWCGSLLFNDYARSALVGDTVINMNFTEPLFPSLDARGYYMGVIDGKTKYGNITGFGDARTMAQPIIAADPNRRALSTKTSPSLNWMKEFFNTTSRPRGHGFTQANLDNDFTSYTFEPKASVPLKVIVLDDTCKRNPYASYGSYARGCLDQSRYDWLVHELDRGQAEGKLMIIAAHVPVGPQMNIPDAPLNTTHPYPNTTPYPVFLSTRTLDPTSPSRDPVPPYSVVTDASLLATLHNYPNLILWIAGHRHLNTVTPQPAPDSGHPEFGFWEVETASLLNFPQQFRTFEIVRNDNNTVSIFITDVDPAVQGVSPAAKSRGYAIGANRIAAGTPGSGLTDTTSHAYNAELIKPLPAPYTITVNVTGPGTVRSSPYSGVECAADSSCSATYLPGTPVTLVATPAAGAAFSGWSTCAGTSPCTMTMKGDVAVTATFTRAPTLGIAPTYKGFGTMVIGERAGATFTVRNSAAKGVADLAIGTISIGGVDAGQFKLVRVKDGCSEQTIEPGMSCSFRVSFAPTSAYARLATITIPSDDPDGPKVIQLTGAGRRRHRN
jgi:hypothetical protein